MILDIAIEEFAANPYPNVSISLIVERAGIAKGSFYQYFEDKADLYLHLIGMFMQEKAKFLAETPPPDPDMGIFEYMRWIARVGAGFEFSNPQLAEIAGRALLEEVPLPDETLKLVRSGSKEFFQDLIQKGIQNGEIDPEVDVDAAVYIFNTVIMGLGQYILDRVGITKQEIVSGERSPLDSPAGEEAYDAVIDLLERGIGTK